MRMNIPDRVIESAWARRRPGLILAPGFEKSGLTIPDGWSLSGGLVSHESTSERVLTLFAVPNPTQVYGARERIGEWFFHETWWLHAPRELLEPVYNLVRAHTVVGEQRRLGGDRALRERLDLLHNDMVGVVQMGSEGPLGSLARDALDAVAARLRRILAEAPTPQETP